jgi:phage-related protein
VTVTSAGSTSWSACSPSTPKISASPTPRHLGGKVRELRFYLLRQQTRVTYWLAPGRRVILLTVFHKTRSAETAEVARALEIQKLCEAGHGIAHEVFDRKVT